MPTPLFTPGDEKQDERLNPSAQDYQRRFDDIVQNSPEYPDVEGGLRNLENSANSQDKSILDESKGNTTVSEREQQSPLATIHNNYTGGKQSKVKGKFNWRKNSTITGIVVTLLGGVGLLTTLFTPGLGIVQMKEVLTGNLNDQLAAMDIRMDHVFRAKLKTISSGVCTGVQIKCKFSTMTERQVNKFKKAFEKEGYVIPDDGVEKTAFGRQRIVKIVGPDGTTITNPANLVTARKSDPKVRSAMNRVYNPLYYGLSDKVANNFFAKNKTNKQKKVTGTTDEERRLALVDVTAGERAQGGGVLTDPEKGRYMVVQNGDQTERVYENDPDQKERFNQLLAEAEQKGALLDAKEKVGGKAVGGVLTGAAKGLSVIGVADSACTVYNTARAVSAAAKVARSMQLVQFAMVIGTTADSIKAGDATPEEVEFIGNMLTTTDTRKTIVDETSTGENIENPADLANAEPVDNPFYNKSAFDSPGYKVAAYNEAPILTSRSQQYMVGGGMSGTLSGVLTGIEQTIAGDGEGSPAALRESCGIIQSPWTRGIGLIAGIFLAIGSFGIGTAVSIAGSVAVSFALPFLEAALADIVAGNVIGEDIAGVDAGDAYFAGTAAMLGGIAQNRGMTPLSEEGFKEYIASTSEVRAEIIAAEKYEASKSPFDMYSQYSFLGTFVRSLYPTAVTAKASANGALLSIGSILSHGFASLTKPASAVIEYNPERFNKCKDAGYEELGVDGDVFCNLRYGLTVKEQKMDSEEVLDYMLAQEYIDGDGEAQGEYAEFMEKCPNRQDGWGETSEENGSIGLECIDGTDEVFKDISYFRVYTMDISISDGIDGDVDPTQQVTISSKPGQYVLPTAKGYARPGPTQDWGPRNTATKFHRGVDIQGFPGNTVGQPVYSIADGEVVRVDKGNPTCAVSDSGSESFNNVVEVQHADGTISGYWHMGVNSIQVEKGDKVVAGQQLGSINQCGWTSGYHLHFTMKPGSSTDPQITSIESNQGYINPYKYLLLRGVDIMNGTYTDGREGS